METFILIVVAIILLFYVLNAATTIKRGNYSREETI
jgi:hypothetical protein